MPVAGFCFQFNCVLVLSLDVPTTGYGVGGFADELSGIINAFVGGLTDGCEPFGSEGELLSSEGASKGIGIVAGRGSDGGRIPDLIRVLNSTMKSSMCGSVPFATSFRYRNNHSGSVAFVPCGNLIAQWMPSFSSHAVRAKE